MDFYDLSHDFILIYDYPDMDPPGSEVLLAEDGQIVLTENGQTIVTEGI